MSSIKVITLDLDDTLWDGRSALVYAEQTVYSWLQQNCPRITAKASMEELVTSRHAMVQHRGDIRHDFTALRVAALEELAAEFGYAASMVEQAMAVFLKARNHVEIFADVVPALEALAKEYQLVSVTNGNADVHKTALGGYFDLAVTPAIAGTAKPDPRMFDVVLNHAGVDAGAVVHVGDEPHTDVVGAQRAGAHAVWINRTGREWPTETAPPHAEISVLGELEAIIRAL
jgi:2-haloalkanoic acid dehalogenase type II